MALPQFQIWKDKPFINDESQYLVVESTDDYYKVGWDDDSPEDDIYTKYWDIHRGGILASDFTYFANKESSLPALWSYGDYLHGVGKFQIKHITVYDQIGGNKNHYDDEFWLWFIDSASFQCDEPGDMNCVSDVGGEIPQDYIHPITGEYLQSQSSIRPKFTKSDNSDAFSFHRRIAYWTNKHDTDCKFLDQKLLYHQVHS